MNAHPDRHASDHWGKTETMGHEARARGYSLLQAAAAVVARICRNVRSVLLLTMFARLTPGVLAPDTSSQPYDP